MPDIMQHILARRSIRQYTTEPVREEEIRKLLQAAMAAPTANNRRPWEFVVVTEGELLSRLRAGLIFGRHYAPLAIVVCGNLRRTLPWPATDFWIEDCSAATQNILLAATGLGLGAVWVGVYPLKPFVKHVSQVLSLPHHVVPLGLVHVGHPTAQRPPRTQYSEQHVHWQRYERVQQPATSEAEQGSVAQQKEGSGVSKGDGVWGEFRKFVLRGNVLDLAVGIVIGAGFTAVVNSFVNDLLMPPIGLLLGGLDFSSFFVVLKQGAPAGPYANLEAAKAAAAVTWRYGLFVNAVVSFLIVATAIFVLIKGVNRLMPKEGPPVPAPATKECPHCAMQVPLKAMRCPYCTSELQE